VVVATGVISFAFGDLGPGTVSGKEAKFPVGDPTRINNLSKSCSVAMFDKHSLDIGQPETLNRHTKLFHEALHAIAATSG